MAQVLTNSFIGYPQSLGIFSKAVQNLGIRKSKIIEYLPTNDYRTQDVIQFSVSGAGSTYLDLSRTQLNVRAKILRGDGSVIGKMKRLPGGMWVPDKQSRAAKKTTAAAASAGASAGASGAESGDAGQEKKTDDEDDDDEDDDTDTFKGTAGVINNFLHSIFSRVDVMLQNKLMTDSDASYPYQAYLKTTLYCSNDLKQESLQGQLYYDSGPPSRPPNWFLSDDPGFKTRSSFFQGSNEVEMTGKLACDLFDMTRLIPNGVNVQISLYPNTPQFPIISNDLTPLPDYKVVITRASLEVCHVEVAPEIMAAHAEILTEQPALYPMTKSEVKKFTVAQGLFSAEINNPFEGRVPSEMVVGIVDGAASHGEYKSDGFYFDHCFANFIQATCNGEDLGNSPMTVKYTGSAASSQFMEAYKSLRGVGGVQGLVPFSRERFCEGNTLYRFVADQDGNGTGIGGGDVMDLKRTGNVRLTIKFDKALVKTKTIVIFAIFPSGFKIDRNRAVHDM